jgi:hypothetical protein
MILVNHVPFYQEIFAIPKFLRGPVLRFGFQEFDQGASVDATKHLHLGEYFERIGLRSTSLDLFDPRAELRYDMNFPVPSSQYGRYAAFIDIGSLKHVFDTRQCLENCMRMVAPGGQYLLHTPVNGYYGHGFHLFNPECLRGVFELNGFSLIYERYSTVDGELVDDPGQTGDILAWMVARKERDVKPFVCPQQRKWYARYAKAEVPDES